MLADKSRYTSVEGLNQHFFLQKDLSGRTYVELVGDVSPQSLGNPILTKIPVQSEVEMIWNGTHIDPAKKSPEEWKPFEERIREYGDYYQRDEKFPVSLGTKCKSCEFRVGSESLSANQRSGYEECWKEALSWREEDFKKPHIFDIWNFRKTEEMMADNIYLMEDLPVEDLFVDSNINGDLGFKSPVKKRQCTQVSMALDKNSEIEVIDPGLFHEMGRWQFPFHFIDFETSMVAIPFNKDRRPYEQIAFQFSCHTIHADGTWRHDEWIEERQGVFPNYDFASALMKILENDNGTIFRYAPHENTILRHIYGQILDALDEGRGLLPENYQELLQFIDEITEWKEPDENGREVRREGPRNMVDMHKLVLDHYYHKNMKGSNSIKSVLSSIIQTSSFLREKYSKPYNSKNFDNMCWWEIDEITGKPKDPYSLLPPLFEDEEFLFEELVLENETIREGGAAMVAYAKMQFSQMSEKERSSIIKGLLKYCELDTLAMVMIYEHWKSLAG
jgi:hypothetical protein